MCVKSFSQTANVSNIISSDSFLHVLPQNKLIQSSAQLLVSSPCENKNTFWAFDSFGASIHEFSLNNASILATGNSISNAPGLNLAICNNLNGGLVSPTFYCSDFTDFYFWNGASNWIQSSTTPSELYNAGGYKKFLYSLTYTSNTLKIIRYDGFKEEL